ncbi:MAG: ADP-ribosylglycohydrolase family protein [Eubacteriales bacterium]|nr:ADP-ribosylglycohydrolase family protein [Eubacteriales bacterium]
MANYVLNGIMGLCVADALGVPVEFMARGTLDANPVVGMRAYGTYNQPAGTWSDDTSMTLCLADSLCRGLDYNDIMQNFLKWFQRGEFTPFGAAFDIGNTTRQALKRFEQGAAPLECGGNTEHDNGNGSLMRILPLLFYLQSIYGREFYQKDEAFAVIHKVSALTHAHKRSQIACGIYILVAAMLPGEINLREAINLGIGKAMEYYRKQEWFAEELILYERVEDKGFAELLPENIRSGGYVVDTLEAAIWCLLNTENYKDCVLKAVNLGSDTDTVAAVAGGLAGLKYGYNDIPQDWLGVIVNREYVESLCNKLYFSLA